MSTSNPSDPPTCDPAAILGAAASLKKACEDVAAKDRTINLSESYNGGDEFMRQVMRVATLFESWCCEHVDFSEFSEVWPYLLEDKFGDACLEVICSTGLADFDEMACLRVAIGTKLPVRVTDKLAVPVNLNADNPLLDSPFRVFQIRSVRLHHEDNGVHAYTDVDDPEDSDFGHIFFGLYGLDADGMAEHIAVRDTYPAAIALAMKLAPGIEFPLAPTWLDSFPIISESVR